METDPAIVSLWYYPNKGLVHAFPLLFNLQIICEHRVINFPQSSETHLSNSQSAIPTPSTHRLIWGPGWQRGYSAGKGCREKQGWAWPLGGCQLDSIPFAERSD